jgi:hypothetical protein
MMQLAACCSAHAITRGLEMVTQWVQSSGYSAEVRCACS